ncbi:hypothetical protein GF406_19575 [candidate division KSB1 bacterium]|nr:hypothetical protein [candidate division KSB1 bacterium]
MDNIYQSQSHHKTRKALVNNSPEILVTGDVVTDNHIYKGKRQVTSSKSKSGTIITQTPGGAWLTYDILKHTASNVRFGLNLDENTKLDQQAFAEWYKTEEYENASKMTVSQGCSPGLAYSAPLGLGSIIVGKCMPFDKTVSGRWSNPISQIKVFA